MRLIIAGGEARVESHTIFLMVRATLTSWLYTLTKNHMKKHQKNILTVPGRDRAGGLQEISANQSQCKTTGWKRVGKVSRDNTNARESILEEDLAKIVSWSLHNSFCLNRESKAKSIPNRAK